MPAYTFYKNYGNVSYSLRGTDKPECLFFAEGDSEALFLEKWLTNLGKNPDEIAVVCYKGESKLRTIFKILSEDENFARVDRFGFYLDAETGSAHYKEVMVTNLLRDFHIIPAAHSVQAGVLTAVNNKRVALVVSPNNANSGCIEDTVMNEIGTSNLFPCIDALKQCLAIQAGIQANSKTLVQAYLGARMPGLCGTGRGFHIGILDIGHIAYSKVRDTLIAVL